MIGKGVTVRFLELPIIGELNNRKENRPIKGEELLNDKRSYYKHIQFRFNSLLIDEFLLLPCFFLADYSEKCLEVKKENDTTFCYTENFIIDIEEAIKTNEVSVGRSKEKTLAKELVKDSVAFYTEELRTVYSYYENGLLTEKERLNQIRSINLNFCIQHTKWEKMMKPNYCIGGVASDIIDETLLQKEKNRNLFLNIFDEFLETGSFNCKIIQNEEEFDLDKIEFGLVSGFVNWSGYTRQVGYEILTELIATNKKNIPLYIIDCDFVSPETQVKLFKTSHWGYFESCWAENGKILKQYKSKQELKPFIEFVAERLLVR